ncbi:MAG: hypothetical protein WKF65_00470 [Gaiellaceae bacterium]
MTPPARPKFDPIAVLQALDRQRVSYVVIGALARVIQGSVELTDGIDLVPSTRVENLRRLQLALEELNARRADGAPLALEANLAQEPVLELQTAHGELKLVPQPAGTRGYDDLRRAANREPLGHGVRPAVASIGDLARMLAALGREQDLAPLGMLHRLAELERELGRGIER